MGHDPCKKILFNVVFLVVVAKKKRCSMLWLCVWLVVVCCCCCVCVVVLLCVCLVVVCRTHSRSRYTYTYRCRCRRHCCCSLTFHNGFMFVASRTCFKHFSRLQASLDYSVSIKFSRWAWTSRRSCWCCRCAATRRS